MTDTDTAAPVVTLDQYRARAQRKHGDLPVPVDEQTTVILRRPMRMSADERKALFAAQKRVQNAQADHSEVVKAKRVLKAAQDRRDGLDPEKTQRRALEEHDRRVSEAQDALDEAEREYGGEDEAQVAELVEGMRDVFRAVADTRGGAERLLEAVGDDLYVLREIMSDWQSEAEPGEAQPSPS